MSDAEEKLKVKLFYYLIGESGRELLETLMSDVAVDARTVMNIIAKFDEHCNPSINKTVERYRFFSKSQGAEQSIDNYVTELRMLAKTCNFGEIKDSLIRDRIVCGINNEGLRERLLREKDLTLQTCVCICRAAELSRQNSKAIAGAAVEEVHAVRQGARQDQHQPFMVNHSLFMGDGCLEGEYKIEIDNTVKPVQLLKRRVPVSMMKPLKEELQDLQRRGIIAPVERSMNWISNMVVVQKPSGRLRVCIDPRPLNRALKCSHFPLPTIDDILPEMSKAKVFTVCDVKSGFWHVKLEEESSYLTTFSSPFGRYRWLRMPMGISPAPEIFQRKLTFALEGLPGIYIIADDVLITGQGETQELAERDHDEKLKAFLARCREKGIKLNADKLKLKQREVSYIGHLLTSDGLKIDPDKVRAITHMSKPTDVKGVQRLLGMVNYLSKFCAHLSDQCEALRQLTRKDCEWRWAVQHEEAFCKIKETIANAPVLKYYNPDEELTIKCDASDGGLGAALMQGGKPVAFTSRALTRTERG